jgi:hypothetical protein
LGSGNSILLLRELRRARGASRLSTQCLPSTHGGKGNLRSRFTNHFTRHAALLTAYQFPNRAANLTSSLSCRDKRG